MSRIGKQAITLPSQVHIKQEMSTIVISGPKGTLSYVLPVGVSLIFDETHIEVSQPDPQYMPMRGLVRTMLANMAIGVSQGFEKKLHVMGVGYAVKISGSKLILSLGFSHPIEYDTPAGISFQTEKDQKGNDIITINGFDKQLVGQVAASLRMLRKPEPYKGKGIRYFGEKVRQKVGKTAGK